MSINEMLAKNAHNREEAELITDHRAALLLETSTGARSLLYAMLVFFVVFLIWANYSEIDEVKKGEGKAIPANEIQKIQNLEGGILKKVYVKSGDVVTEGQLLMELDDLRFSSESAKNISEYYGMKARIDRLNAEAKGVEPVFSDALHELYPDLIIREHQLYNTRIKNLHDQTDGLHSRHRQKESELRSLTHKLHGAEKAYLLAKQEFDLLRSLEKEGASSHVEVLKSEQNLSQVESEYRAEKSSVPKVKDEIKEIEQDIERVKSDFVSKALDERNSLSSKVNQLEAEQKSLKDKVKRTKIHSSLAGIVKKININTIGGVVQPGMTMMEIVPSGEQLLVETKIKPKDIGFIRPGLKATVKFTAYDFSSYGGMEGVVQQISADSITDKKGQTFYLVKIKTDKTHLGSDAKPLPIIPGMRAQVSIVVTKKTVLSYLFKPILKATLFAENK